MVELNSSITVFQQLEIAARGGKELVLHVIELSLPINELAVLAPDAI